MKSKKKKATPAAKVDTKKHQNSRKGPSVHVIAAERVRGVNDSHEAAIDEYYVNGFNGGRAVLDTKGSDTMAAARVKWSYIIGHEGNKAYIDAKRAELKRRTDVSNELILRELISWAYVDATQFIDLTPEQVKQLPPEVRRSIQSFEAKTNTYTDRNGDTHTEKVMRVKLIDKQKALEHIGRHVGFYEADNAQKAARININNLPAATINVLLNHLRQEGEG